MNVEARITAIEDRLTEVEAEVRANRPKLDHLRQAIVGMHDELRKLRAELPDILTQTVGNSCGRTHQTSTSII